MGNTLEGMVKTVSGIGDYAGAFEKAFGPGPITPEKVAMAIATFERTILSGDAPHDRFKAGNPAALSDAAKRGLAVFEGKGRCVVCHLGPSFMDNQFHNLGVGTENPKPDAGRMDFTKEEKDWAKFKTPTLRNVALTAPYMHDGSEATLEAVVALYDRGGIEQNLDR
jgi:cytochrome c peroxidase